jgi:hypothetical protein
LVFECHGKQHYIPVAFDGDNDKAIGRFRDLKGRDREKKEAALSAGFVYVEIPYTMLKRLSEELLLDRVEVARREEWEPTQPSLPTNAQRLKEEQKLREKALRKQRLGSPAHKKRLEEQRSYRQRQYREYKQRQGTNGRL